MSLQGLHGTPPSVPLERATGETGAAASRGRVPGTADATAATSTDGPKDTPTPLRFPWLSRLSTQLAAASKTPTPFAAPVLGDNLDKRA